MCIHPQLLTEKVTVLNMAAAQSAKTGLNLQTDEQDFAGSFNVRPFRLNGRPVMQWAFQLNSIPATEETWELKVEC